MAPRDIPSRHWKLRTSTNKRLTCGYTALVCFSIPGKAEKKAKKKVAPGQKIDVFACKCRFYHFRIT